VSRTAGRQPGANETLLSGGSRLRSPWRISNCGALLRIATGYAGHTQVLGLFDRSVSVCQERTTVDHIAFTIGLPDYDSERKRLETLGLNVEVKEHQWVNWRSLYFHDPEGNQIELVCYDEHLSASSRPKMAADLIDVRQRRVSSASFAPGSPAGPQPDR
jgi:hypothetical protein